MKTVTEVLAMAKDQTVHVKTLKATASDVLGDDHPATSRAEIIEALEQIKQEASVNADDMRQVELIRKYAPMGKYSVLEEGGYQEEYKQAEDGIQRTVDAGTIVFLPLNEAKRALHLGVATVTAASL
jgi:hypothetical protein